MTTELGRSAKKWICDGMVCAPPPNTALPISMSCDAEWKVQIMALFKMAHVLRMLNLRSSHQRRLTCRVSILASVACVAQNIHAYDEQVLWMTPNFADFYSTLWTGLSTSWDFPLKTVHGQDHAPIRLLV